MGNTVGQNLDLQAPLVDVNFNADLRPDFQFNCDDYSRLIGMLMLGMALETVQRARLEQRDEQRWEYLKAYGLQPLG